MHLPFSERERERGMQSGGEYPVVSFLLQQTLRRLCTQDTSDWVYAVFWRILPRNYPPPKWESESSTLDRSKGNKRNWILVWEDGYCDFATCAKSCIFGDENARSASLSKVPSSPDHQLQNSSTINDQHHSTSCMQPELFFKMSHEVYNFGEGLMGKVAAENSHKWVYKEPNEPCSQYTSSWQGTLDPHPRTWEAQFKSGIETIAIMAVKEGVLQLGSLKKVSEDLNLVLSLQRKFNYLQSIPGVYAVHPVQLMQHATSSSSPRKPLSLPTPAAAVDAWPPDRCHPAAPYWSPDLHAQPLIQPTQLYSQPIQPGMQTSLQALLLRLPAVTVPPPSTASSSSTSPTGHPYSVFAAPFEHMPASHLHLPAHQHNSGGLTGFTAHDGLSDQDLHASLAFYKS